MVVEQPIIWVVELKVDAWRLDWLNNNVKDDATDDFRRNYFSNCLEILESVFR